MFKLKQYWVTLGVAVLLLVGCNSGSNGSSSSCGNFYMPSEYATSAKDALLIGYESAIFANQFRYVGESNGISYNMIGSAQFSPNNFRNELNFLLESNQIPQLIDIDLRQEYHGFINSFPVTFFVNGAPNDNINAGKSTIQIMSQESSLFQYINKAYSSIIVNIYPSYLALTGPYVESCEPSNNSQTENIWINSNREIQSIILSYDRITIQDHSAPDNTAIDSLVSLYDNVLVNSPTTWVYFHCLVGDGRTVISMIMLAMLKQETAGQLQPFGQTLNWIDEISNFSIYPPDHGCTLSSTSIECQNLWKIYDTAEKFYQFVSTRSPNQSWSSWLESHE